MKRYELLLITMNINIIIMVLKTDLLVLKNPVHFIWNHFKPFCVCSLSMIAPPGYFSTFFLSNIFSPIFEWKKKNDCKIIHSYVKNLFWKWFTLLFNLNDLQIISPFIFWSSYLKLNNHFSFVPKLNKSGTFKQQLNFNQITPPPSTLSTIFRSVIPLKIPENDFERGARYRCAIFNNKTMSKPVFSDPTDTLSKIYILREISVF